jgi:hypothetical protein
MDVVLRHAVGLVLLAYLSSPVSAGVVTTPGESTASGSVPAARRSAPKPRRLYAGVVFGGGAWTSEDNDGFGTLGLSLGGYPRPRVRVDGIVTFNGIAFLPDSALGKAFRNAEAEEIGLDLTARYDPPGDEARLRIYPLVGVGAGTMFWKYSKPVTVTQDGAPKAVGYDGIFYFSFFGGGGATLQLTRNLGLAGSVTGGTRLYDQSLGSGSMNDLLKPTGFLRILLELNCRVH